MSACEQGPQRGNSKASHVASVAQKLLCWAALACSCDDGTDRPPVDPDDVDGDGIANAEDVCPGVRDPAQHDEDGDRIGDACDVCPTVVDPEQADRGELDAIAFEDGVGDACDPRPSRGGDKIGALHTFAADSTPSWLGAGWTIDGDRARAAAGSPARWRHRRAEQGDAVSARLAVEAVVFAADGASLSVTLDGDGVQSGRACTLLADRDADGSGELEVRELGGAAAVRAVPGAAPGAALGPLELIVLRGIDRMGGKVVCRLQYPDGRDPIEASIATIDNLTTGQYVMAAAGADVTVTSLVVYASPVACPAPAGLAACNIP